MREETRKTIEGIVDADLGAAFGHPICVEALMAQLCRNVRLLTEEMLAARTVVPGDVYIDTTCISRD